MKETKKIWKIFLVWEFEKEEAWLNQMAMAGWTLCKVGFCNYTFEKTEPGEYIVRMEMRKSDEAYREFMADAGIEFIGRVTQWHYYKKRSELGPFDLYSDIDSRIAQLNRIGKMLWLICLANLIIGIANTINTYANFGWVNLLCATLLSYALGRIHGKKESLEKDRLLYE